MNMNLGIVITMFVNVFISLLLDDLKKQSSLLDEPNKKAFKILRYILILMYINLALLIIFWD